jgi:hypothetical protein
MIIEQACISFPLTATQLIGAANESFPLRLYRQGTAQAFIEKISWTVLIKSRVML